MGETATATTYRGAVPDSSPTPDPTDKPETVLLPVRRAPNFVRFMLAGGLIGVLAGLVFGATGDSGGYDASTPMALFAVIFGAVGVALAAVVALVLDGRSRRK